LSEQRLRAYEGQRLVLDTAISSGSASYPTPTGTFSIRSKETMHWSTQYSAWMPYAMRVVGGIFIHETPIGADGGRIGASEIGSPASHGCIRVPSGAAHRLFNWAEIGTPVLIR
jgi:lipoprotein-anchoring transpeptidase ErfK/SrfK